MHKALIYIHKRSLINHLKRGLRKPLRLIGFILIVVYFISIPFTMIPLLNDFGLNTPTGYVVITSVFTIYLIMPTTLTYLRRKGINFKQHDVQLIFPTPITPKQAIIYALTKSLLPTFIMQIVFFISAIVVFNIPFPVAIIYSSVDMILSTLSQYSLALVMYSSESLSINSKNWIRRIVYLILGIITVFSGWYLFTYGLSVSTSTSLISHPLILMVPFFGWMLGWLNLMIIGPTLINILASCLYLIFTICITLYAFKMPCKGEYYEDALAFSSHLALMEAKKGKVTLAEALGKKSKAHNLNGQLRGSKAHVIFSRQLITHQRSTRFFLRFQDLLFLLTGLALPLANNLFNLEIPNTAFFAIICGVSLYLTIFFTPYQHWRDDFEHYTTFIIPDSIERKLIYATVLEHLFSFIRALSLTIPAGLLLKASFVDIVLAIIAQTTLSMFITHFNVLTKEYLGVKMGQISVSLLNILLLIIALIIPIIALIASVLLSSFVGLTAIVVYCGIMIYILLKISAKALANIEGMRS